jgi:hypothetical protein
MHLGVELEREAYQRLLLLGPLRIRVFARDDEPVKAAAMPRDSKKEAAEALAALPPPESSEETWMIVLKVKRLRSRVESPRDRRRGPRGTPRRYP